MKKPFITAMSILNLIHRVGLKPTSPPIHGSSSYFSYQFGVKSQVERGIHRFWIEAVSNAQPQQPLERHPVTPRLITNSISRKLDFGHESINPKLL